MIKKILGAIKSEGDRSATKKAKKKNNGYFLEIDDNEKGNSVDSESAKPSSVEKTLEKQVTKVADRAIETLVNTVNTVSESSPSLNGKKSAKDEKNGKSSAKVEAKEKNPAKVKAANNSNTNNGKVEPEPEITFAPTNLMPIPTNSRRLPGPSMNMFKDMARQVKNPTSRG